MTDLRSALVEALAAADAVDSPHVDLGEIFGIRGPLRVSVTDLHGLLDAHPEMPGVRLSWEGGELAVKHENGETMATLAVRW